MLDTRANVQGQAWLERAALTRVIASLIAAELALARSTDMQRLRPDLWSSTKGMVETDLAMDSLERTNCASALNQFFHLSDYGAEDYLLAAETLGDWVSIVAISIAEGSQQVTFETSGSTGIPKLCTHPVGELHKEATFWADHFSSRTQVVSMVPPHHIYGLLFTALLPQILDVPVIDVRHTGASGLKAALQTPGSLVVGAPVHWRYVARSFLTFPGAIEGVTSTAPTPPQLAVQLKSQGLEALTEVYGSSETAGVGFRTDPSAPYTLLPGWGLEGSEESLQLRRTDTSACQPVMDTLAPGPAHNQFTLRGRKDGAVQVGGMNVFPSRVADIIGRVESVDDCHVLLCPQTQRLKAFVVPAKADADPDGIEASLRAHCKTVLSAPERPSAFTFGRAVPRTAMGKAANW